MQVLETLTEERVARLRSGDPSVMSELYDAYSPALFGVVLRILRSQTHAEDILQETFARVWTKRDAFAEGKGSLFTWMLNIARNLAIDTLRSASFNTVGIQTDDSSVGIGEQTDDPRPRGDTLDLKKFVDTLPREQQEIIELVYFKGFTQSEIADERGIPLGTVKSRLRLAMNTLRTIYGVPS